MENIWGAIKKLLQRNSGMETNSCHMTTRYVQSQTVIQFKLIQKQIQPHLECVSFITKVFEGSLRFSQFTQAELPLFKFHLFTNNLSFFFFGSYFSSSRFFSISSYFSIPTWTLHKLSHPLSASISWGLTVHSISIPSQEGLSTKKLSRVTL